MATFGLFSSRYLTARRRKTSILSLLPMLLIGGAFLFSGIGMLSSSVSTGDRTATTVGMVVDVSTSRDSDGDTLYAPVIGYMVEGEQYRVKKNTSTSWRPEIGKEYEIAYNPNDPADATVPIKFGSGEFWLFAIFPFAGLLVILIGAIGYIRSVLRTKEIDRLLDKGTKLDGILIDIKAGLGKRNGQKSYQLVVAATDLSGQVRNFLSDKLVGIPGGLIGMDLQSAALPIDVFVDPVDDDKHYVDLADIPSLTPDRINDLIKNVSQPASTSQSAQSFSAPPKPANQQLVDYILSQQKAGYADDVILNNLHNSGWMEEDIKEAFKSL